MKLIAELFCKIATIMSKKIRNVDELNNVLNYLTYFAIIYKHYV